VEGLSLCIFPQLCTVLCPRHVSTSVFYVTWNMRLLVSHVRVQSVVIVAYEAAQYPIPAISRMAAVRVNHHDARVRLRHEAFI
jgi:hypothetical protein